MIGIRNKPKTFRNLLNTEGTLSFVSDISGIFFRWTINMILKTMEKMFYINTPFDSEDLVEVTLFYFFVYFKNIINELSEEYDPRSRTCDCVSQTYYGSFTLSESEFFL